MLDDDALGMNARISRRDFAVVSRAPDDAIGVVDQDDDPSFRFVLKLDQKQDVFELFVGDALDFHWRPPLALRW